MKPHFNRKPEYLSNYITHKSVDEGALEREKKERKVDEKDKDADITHTLVTLSYSGKQPSHCQEGRGHASAGEDYHRDKQTDVNHLTVTS